MASDAKFISEYISACVKNGKDAAKSAKAEIEIIDNQLNEAESLKLKRMKLMSVLEHFGDDTYRRRRANATPSSDDVDVSSDDIKELLIKIRDIVVELGPISVRDLIQKVGGYDQDTLIMRSVKSLGDRGILSRDSEGRVQRGKKWQEEI